MLASTGNLALFLSIFFIILSCIFSYNSKKIFFKTFVILSHIFVISSFLILLALFVTRDLTVVSVLMNTSSLMSLKYRIAALWSSHETSMLFWAFCNSLVGLLYLINTKFLKTRDYLYYLILESSFLLLSFYSANPFFSIQTLPEEGLGMNPALQDFGMMIHPPLLYLAYSIYQLIFCVALSAKFSSRSFSSIKTWSMIGLSILTVAICLGSWWAYRELGWGGYWYFDPVENISLLVWLLALALHHSLLLKDKNNFAGNQIQLDNNSESIKDDVELINGSGIKYLFAVSVFLAILFGTFITRSGLLVSVHSFAESASSKWILASFCLCFIFAIIPLKNTKFFTGKNNQSFYILGLICLISISVLIIILSLLYPSFIYYYHGNKIEIEPEFFVLIMIPIFLLAGLLISIMYSHRIKREIILYLGLMPVIIMVKYYGGNLYSSIGYYIGLSIILYSLIRIKNTRSHSTSSILSHFAVGLLILSLSINNHLSKSWDLILEKSGKTELENGKFAEITNITYMPQENFLKQTAEIIISTDNKNIAILYPELRFYPVEKRLSAEASLKNSLFHDWYSVINNIEGEKISFTIYYHPAISFIWFSCFLMAFGVMLTPLLKLKNILKKVLTSV
jgi:cytochrome c-type biogenesis protein CcmF